MAKRFAAALPAGPQISAGASRPGLSKVLEKAVE
jgi:hypothetical protein